ncbi:hypothetical protein OHC33_007559 [Knufia fluminis]|uniref:F-box domain-containing protein n=1 Tax=Knufia fluminis TaxID=191047 RepID=A0AAN8EH99_9EURO|nr:hypothetical protein OHC33_007559 [Knufia fluminis]
MRRISRLLTKSSASAEAKCEDKHPRALPVQDCLLWGLPTEILIAIEAFLPYENAVAFSLTCRILYDLFFKLHKPSPKHHGREAHLLRLIERDLSSQLSCPVHERLYSWRKAKSRHYQCPSCTSKNRPSTGSLVICNKGCKPSFYGIFEPERRLMIRHGILGPEFGISRRTLDHVCKKSFSKRANEIRPKLVNGALMIWRTHHYTVRIDFQTWAELELEHVDEAICVHSKMGFQALVCAATEHARKQSEIATMQFASGPRAVHTEHWQCPTLFKCQYCSTDIKVRMDQVSGCEVVVRFDVYQHLGGLNELTISQRQVLGGKHELTDEEKVERQIEDLEQRYHGGEGLNRAEITDVSRTTPNRTALLNLWTRDVRSNPLCPMSFRLDATLSKQFREIQFVP